MEKEKKSCAQHPLKSMHPPVSLPRTHKFNGEHGLDGFLFLRSRKIRANPFNLCHPCLTGRQACAISKQKRCGYPGAACKSS